MDGLVTAILIDYFQSFTRNYNILGSRFECLLIFIVFLAANILINAVEFTESFENLFLPVVVIFNGRIFCD